MWSPAVGIGSPPSFSHLAAAGRTPSDPDPVPRHRVILVVWLTGAVLLLGAWAHSLFRQSYVACRSTELQRHYQVGIAAGSLSFHAHHESYLHTAGLIFLSEPWQTEPDPFSATPPKPIPPPSYVGRFRAHDGHLEVPFWFLILFFTGLCVPFRLHALESPRWRAHLLAVDQKLLEGDRKNRLPFKLY